MGRAHQRGDELFRRRLRRALGKRRNRRIENIHTRFDSHHVSHLRQTGRAVRVQMQRQRDARFDFFNDLVGGVGREQPAHVLQANDLHAHVGELFRHTEKIIRRMHRTDGVTDRAFDQLAGLKRRVNGGLHVAHIVHGIEDTEHIDAVGGGALHEGLNDIVRIVLVTDHVLAAQEHLETRLRHRRAQFAQALPGTFFEITQRRVEGRTAPSFQRPVADVVELRGDRQHVFGPHARRHQTLVRIAQHRLHDFDLTRHMRWLPIGSAQS